jgi:hypothetical protein
VRLRVPLALTMLAFVAFLPGCGGGSDDGAEAMAQRNAATRAALANKLDRLRDELRRRRTLLRARHEQVVQRAAHERSRAVAQGAADANSFAQVAASLDGEVGAVIGPPGSSEAVSVGSLRSGSAWSTSKVPIALRVLEDAGGPGGLSSAQAEEMRNAITLSDNEAAAALFGSLERSHGGLAGASAAIDEVLREGGDGGTQISTQGRGEFSTYGQTEWSLVNQQRFMSSLAAGCLGDSGSSDYVLDLMGEVSSDTWGLGSAGLPARWKGGWGPGVDGGYLVRQMGILYVGDKQAVVTLAARPADGQFATGESMATAVAQWLAKIAAHMSIRFAQAAMLRVISA